MRVWMVRGWALFCVGAAVGAGCKEGSKTIRPDGTPRDLAAGVDGSGGSGGRTQPSGGSTSVVPDTGGSGGSAPETGGGPATGGVATGGSGGEVVVISTAGAAGTAGSAGAGGEGGAAGSVAYPPTSSCDGLTATCNDNGVQISCCTALPVPGGTCWRGANSSYPATVAAFVLDKYEATVGRFRRFLAAYDGWRAAGNPQVGAGAHPLISDSGWNASWDASLPATAVDFANNLQAWPDAAPYTTAPGPNESAPVNNLIWFEAFAFCLWDGGRLPTEAEWAFVAGGGDENRTYPWGEDATTPLPANYDSHYNSPFLPVGSDPAGNGRWNHSDLAGSVYEWVLDWEQPYLVPCDNCANLTPSTLKIARGGSWSDPESSLLVAFRGHSYIDGRWSSVGVRCARD